MFSALLQWLSGVPHNMLHAECLMFLCACFFWAIDDKLLWVWYKSYDILCDRWQIVSMIQNLRQTGRTNTSILYLRCGILYLQDIVDDDVCFLLLQFIKANRHAIALLIVAWYQNANLRVLLPFLYFFLMMRICFFGTGLPVRHNFLDEWKIVFHSSFCYDYLLPSRAVGSSNQKT